MKIIKNHIIYFNFQSIKHICTYYNLMAPRQIQVNFANQFELDLTQSKQQNALNWLIKCIQRNVTSQAKITLVLPAQYFHTQQFFVSNEQLGNEYIDYYIDKNFSHLKANKINVFSSINQQKTQKGSLINLTFSHLPFYEELMNKFYFYNLKLIKWHNSLDSQKALFNLFLEPIATLFQSKHLFLIKLNENEFCSLRLHPKLDWVYQKQNTNAKNKIVLTNYKFVQKAEYIHLVNFEQTEQIKDHLNYQIQPFTLQNEHSVQYLNSNTIPTHYFTEILGLL